MLTVDLDRLGVRPGERVLDLGCGGGRHAFALAERGARVVALDRSDTDLKDVAALLAALDTEHDGVVVNGDGTSLPFPDASFDRVIAAEVLEHVPDERAAFAELARVLRPGGVVAATVPAWLPEKVCWALSEQYHAPFVEGGHVRIYTEPGLRRSLQEAGLAPVGSHRVHALHSPYWWLRCAVGPTNDTHPLVRAYHQVLVWDITSRPWPTRLAERVLDPVLGKSLVVYAEKPSC